MARSVTNAELHETLVILEGKVDKIISVLPALAADNETNKKDIDKLDGRFWTAITGVFLAVLSSVFAWFHK